MHCLVFQTSYHEICPLLLIQLTATENKGCKMKSQVVCMHHLDPCILHTNRDIYVSDTNDAVKQQRKCFIVHVVPKVATFLKFHNNNFQKL
jgi:hypothetical protein